MKLRAKLAKLQDPAIRAKNIDAMRLALRERWYSLRRPALPDPVFVIGCSRAGTTVTFETLAASGHFVHFDFEIPQFWNSLWGPALNGWESEAADVTHARPEHRDRALAHYYARLGPGQVLDKTCINALRVAYLDRLFPKARFVFIYRDGRDNISSMIDGWRLGRTDGGFGLEKFHGPSPEPVAINGGEFHEWHFFLPPGWRAYNRSSLEQVCAFQWLTANRLALDAGRRLPTARWIELRHEDLLDHPVAAFRDVFSRLDLPFSAELEARCAALASRPTSIVKGGPAKGKWRTHNPDAIRRVLPLIAPLQRELGYDTDA